MVEKIKPNNYIADSKVSAKDNKNSKGEVTSKSYSTVIPKPILTKLGLQKGQLLYWDINDENNIIITPEINPVPTPEEASIEAGFEILQDMLFNGKSEYYTSAFHLIKSTLSNEKTNVSTDTEKIEYLVDYYNTILSDRRNGIVKYNQEGFKQVVLYLLDYPLNLPSQFEILREVYNEITKSD